MNPEILKLKEEIAKLRQDISDLNSEIYTNNFTAHQDFNKSSAFTTRLRVPHYASAPTQAETGEIIEVGGKLYICSATNTFSLVGTQT